MPMPRMWRDSSPRAAGRRSTVAVEVRVPSRGWTFAALAVGIRADRVFLSTFQELEPGTVVVLVLALDGDPLVLQGVVRARGASGPGLSIGLSDVDVDACERLDALVPDELLFATPRVA
jgi:hypothetical protein